MAGSAVPLVEQWRITIKTSSVSIALAQATEMDPGLARGRTAAALITALPSAVKTPSVKANNIVLRSIFYHL